MSAIHYYVRAAWDGRREPIEVIARTFLQCLGDLEKIDPRLGDWGVGVPDGVEPLDAHRADLAALVRSNVVEDDAGEPDPEEGYLCYAINLFSRHAGRRPDTATLLVNAGGAWTGNFNFEVGNAYVPPDPSLVTYPIYKAALLALVAAWRPPWASAQCSVWGSGMQPAPDDPTFPYSGFQFPWIGYLAAEQARGVDPPAGLTVERTPDGGLLVSTAAVRPDPYDPAQVRAARALVDIMMEHGGKPGY